MREIFYVLAFSFIVIVIGNVVIVAQTDMETTRCKKRS